MQIRRGGGDYTRPCSRLSDPKRKRLPWGRGRGMGLVSMKPRGIGTTLRTTPADGARNAFISQGLRNDRGGYSGSVPEIGGIA